MYMGWTRIRKSKVSIQREVQYCNVLSHAKIKADQPLTSADSCPADFCHLRVLPTFADGCAANNCC